MQEAIDRNFKKIDVSLNNLHTALVELIIRNNEHEVEIDAKNKAILDEVYNAST